MLPKEAALNVTKSYVARHQEYKSDTRFIYSICRGIANAYDRVETKLTLEAFICNYLNILLLKARQEGETQSVSYIRQSSEVWDEVLKEILNGDDKQNIASKHNVTITAINYHMSKWRKSGLLPCSAEQKTARSAKSQLSFLDAYEDMPSFLSTVLNGAKVIESSGSTKRKCTTVTYSLPNGSELTVTIATREVSS